MENKFRVKREMYDILAEYCDELNTRINGLQEELDKALAKDEEERDYWEEDRIKTYPDKIKALRQVIAHMEKLL